MKHHSLFVIVALVLGSVSAQAQGRGGAAGQTPAGTPPAPIVRTASLSGQVVDADSGAPVGGAIVRLQSRLLAAAAPAGGRGAGAPMPNPLQPNVPPGTDAVIADGDGRFVFHSLPRGATQLTATAAGYIDRPASGVPQRPIQLEDGKHLDGVRLRLLKVASVTGVVLDEAGEPVVGLPVRVLRRETPQGIPRFALSSMARTDDRGHYRLDNLAPGQIYVLALALKPGAKISGQVVFDGAAAKPATLTNVQVSFALTGGGSGGSAPTRLTSEATFKTSNYAPGIYTASASGVPGPWLLRSVTVGGRDVMGLGLEVGETDVAQVELTFTDRPSSVTGFVRQDSSSPLPNATVLLVAADYRVALNAGLSPRQQTAAVQPTSAFTLGRLLPGDYFLVALLDEAVPVERDAGFYEALTRTGTRVSVAEGETKTQDLRIVRSIR